MAIGAGKSVGRLQAYLGLDSSEFYASLAGAQAAMKSAAASMKAAGRMMTTFVTLPLLAVGAGAVKMAMDFETAFARIQGLAGVPQEEIEGLKKSVKELSEEMGRPPMELAQALYFTASSGFEGAAALDLVRNAAKAARAGLGETSVVADLLTSVLNAYGHANISAARASDVLTEAVRLGKAEPAAMAANLGFVIPIAAEMGVEFEQVAAAVAAMSRKMSATDVSTAVTNLRQVLSDLLSPSQHSRKALEAWGTSASELRKVIKEDGLLEALGFVASKMNENEEAFSTIFGNVRSLTGALSLAGVSAEGVSEIFEQMKDSTGELDYAVSVAANTTEDKFNRSMATLKVTMIELGSVLLPIFNDLVGAIRDAANWFKGLSSEGQKTVIMAAALAAALGPALIVLGSVVGVLAAITPAIAIVVVAVGALAVSFIYLYENWAAVKERVSDWSWWKNMLIDMAQYFVLSTSGMITLGVQAWNWFANQIIDVMNNLIFVFNGLAAQTGGLIPLIKDIGKIEIANPLMPMLEGLDSLRGETKTYEHEFKGFTESITDFAKKAGKALAGMFGSAGGGGGGGTTTAPRPSGGSGAVATSFVPQAPQGQIKLGVPGLGPVVKEVEHLNKLMEHMVERTLVEFAEGLGNLFTGEVDAVGFFKGILIATMDFLKAFGAALIAAGVASDAFKKLLGNPIAAIIAGAALIVAATVVKNIINKGPAGRAKGMAVGGTVTQGGVFQLHSDELVSLPMGSAVTPAPYATLGGGGNGGGVLSTQINLRRFIIELDRERQRMGR